MVTIEVNNSTAKLIGITKQHLAQLRQVYSYVDRDASKHSQFPVRVHAIDRHGVFGSGLVPEVAEKLRRVGQVAIVDLRRQPEDSERDRKLRLRRTLGLTPYPEQTAVVEALKKFHTGVGILPTGVGKSVVISLTVDELKLPTLILVPNLNLKIQLYRDLVHLFGTQKVGMISKTKIQKFITIANIQALANLPNDIFQDKRLLIVDERHHQAADSYITANADKLNSVYYRLCLTATDFRSNPEEDVFLRAFTPNTLVSMTQEEAIDKGYICRPRFKAYNVHHTQAELDALKEAKSYFDMRRILYNESNSYNLEICQRIYNSLREGKPTVVLFDQIEHINNVVKMLETYEIVPTLVTGLTEDNQKRIEAFNRGEVQLLLGTGCLGEGVNTKPVRSLILAAPGRAKSQFFQNVGRGLRISTGKQECDVWVPRVGAHTIFASHFHNRMNFCKEYGKYGEVVWEK